MVALLVILAPVLAVLALALLASGGGLGTLFGIVSLIAAFGAAFAAVLSFRRSSPPRRKSPPSKTQLFLGSVFGVILGVATLVQVARGLSSGQLPGFGKRAPATLLSEQPVKFIAKLALLTAGGTGLLWYFLPPLGRRTRDDRDA